jgi:hypothetical protein
MPFNKEKLFISIRKVKPNVDDKTIETYLLSLNKISRELFLSDFNIKYYTDYDSVVEYLENIPNTFSRKCLCTSIVVVIKCYPRFNKKIKEKYSMYLRNLANTQEEHYKKNIKSEKEEQNWITKNEILDLISKKLNEINTFDKIDTFYKVDLFQQYLVLNLYTLLPPIRNDYVRVKVVNNKNLDKELDTKCNYINLYENVLYLCNYKTSKFYGTKKIELPEKLVDIIKKYQDIKENYLGRHEESLLLNVRNKKPMASTNTLTKYLNKIFFPKKISTTILRKVYLSEKYPISHSMAEMELDAACMGHDINMARKIYTKIL